MSDEQPETPAGTPTDQPPADPAQMIEPAQDGAPAPDAVDPGAMDMAAAMGGEARQLSQDEIDNLLGMDAAAPAEEAPKEPETSAAPTEAAPSETPAAAETPAAPAAEAPAPAPAAEAQIGRAHV